MNKTICVVCGEYHYHIENGVPYNSNWNTIILEGYDEPVCERCVLKYERLNKLNQGDRK